MAGGGGWAGGVIEGGLGEGEGREGVKSLLAEYDVCLLDIDSHLIETRTALARDDAQGLSHKGDGACQDF